MPETTPRIDDLPALPRDQSGPVFQEPWQAQAFALAVHLSAAGHFTWQEWVEVLSQQIKTAQAQGDADLGDTYYRHWLAALEQLCAARGLVGPQDLQRRTEEWRRAYLNTPHGQPVALSAACQRARRQS
jgi:nitrile hydratase accessory protein